MYPLTLPCFAVLSSSRQEQGIVQCWSSGGWSWNLPQVRNSGVFNLNWGLDSLEVAQFLIHIEIHTYFLSLWWFPFPRNGRRGRKAVSAQAEERESQFRAAFSQRFPIFPSLPKSPISIFINSEVLPAWAPMLGKNQTVELQLSWAWIRL